MWKVGADKPGLKVTWVQSLMCGSCLSEEEKWGWNHRIWKILQALKDKQKPGSWFEKWVFRVTTSSLLWGTILGLLCHPWSGSLKAPSHHVCPAGFPQLVRLQGSWPGLKGTFRDNIHIGSYGRKHHFQKPYSVLTYPGESWAITQCSVRWEKGLWGRWEKRSPDTVTKMYLESGGMVELLGFNKMLAFVLCSQGINPQNARFERKAWQPTPVFLLRESHVSTEEPGGLRSRESQRVGHDWSDLVCMHRNLKLFLVAEDCIPAWDFIIKHHRLVA